MVIVDTSCLITLDRIERLDILKSVFGEIAITEEIKKEFGHPLPDWVKIVPVRNVNYLKLLLDSLDAGEASAIAVAQENQDAFLVMDELNGRRTAEKLQLSFTGTLGVLLQAKKMGSVASVKSIIDELKEINFRVSHEVESEILRRANEIT